MQLTPGDAGNNVNTATVKIVNSEGKKHVGETVAMDSNNLCTCNEIEEDVEVEIAQRILIKLTGWFWRSVW